MQSNYPFKIFLAPFHCASSLITLNSSIFVSDVSLEDLIEKILSAANKGISVSRDDPGESNWSFAQSLFFSSTVVTTIGKF